VIMLRPLYMMWLPGTFDRRIQGPARPIVNVSSLFLLTKGT